MSLDVKVDMSKILRLWENNPYQKLKFKDIQSIFGWNNRKLSLRLAKLVNEGYLKKDDEHYISTEPEYMDILMFGR